MLVSERWTYRKERCRKHTGHKMFRQGRTVGSFRMKFGEEGVKNLHGTGERVRRSQFKHSCGKVPHQQEHAHRYYRDQPVFPLLLLGGVDFFSIHMLAFLRRVGTSMECPLRQVAFKQVWTGGITSEHQKRHRWQCWPSHFQGR